MYNLTSLYYILCFLLLIQNRATSLKKTNHFKLVYQWKQIEYKFKNEEERSEAISNGTFNVGKIQPIDAQYVYISNSGREIIFITTPRSEVTGSPATLGTVTKKSRDGNPIIDPYPSWSWHLNPEKCSYHRLVSVFRVWADECDRLWVMDNGVVAGNFSCTPQLLAFDLKTDKLLYRYEIPYDQYQNVSWFVTPLAEVESKKKACENTWVYAADPVGYSLLVYSLKQNTSWRILDNTFKPDPNYFNYTIRGDTFELQDGIITVALSPATDGSRRKLRYHALSNIRESFVFVKDLKNPKNFEVPYGSSKLFYTYKNQRDQQSVIEATDRKGILYFSLVIDVELVRWDPRTPYIRKNFQVLADNPETMQFPSGLKISPYRGKDYEAVWMFSTAYQRFESGRLNGNETNFRLFVMKL